jgi:hypothetical protein
MPTCQVAIFSGASVIHLVDNNILLHNAIVAVGGESFEVALPLREFICMDWEPFSRQDLRDSHHEFGNIGGVEMCLSEHFLIEVVAVFPPASGVIVLVYHDELMEWKRQPRTNFCTKMVGWRKGPHPLRGQFFLPERHPCPPGTSAHTTWHVPHTFAV